MKKILPVLYKDGYKASHKAQYPEGTTLVYSNWTPRSSRDKNVDKVVFFGLQYFIIEYLMRQFNENFFELDKEEVLRQYKRRMDNYLGPDSFDISHIGELHDLGYLPIKIKALPEGTLCPLRIPMLTIENTLPQFFWLTNLLETIMSAVLWKPCTSATIARQYRKKFEEYAAITGSSPDIIQFLGHDFSFRGMPGLEAASLSGAGHLLSFTGTDTIPAIDFLEEYYEANSDEELVACSVPATEHSVACMGSAFHEIEVDEEYWVEVMYDDGGNIVSEKEL